MKADGRIKLQHEIIAGGFVSEEQSVIVYSIKVLILLQFSYICLLIADL